MPPLKSHVNDLSQLLSPNCRAALNVRLVNHEQDTGEQIVTLTVPTLSGARLKNSVRVAQKWQLGQAKQDNDVGMLMDVAEHKMRIEVGYELKGWLTDARSSHTIGEVLQPAFRRGTFAEGLNAAVLPS